MFSNIFRRIDSTINRMDYDTMVFCSNALKILIGSEKNEKRNGFAVHFFFVEYKQLFIGKMELYFTHTYIIPYIISP